MKIEDQLTLELMARGAVLRVLDEYGGTIPAEDLRDAVEHYVEVDEVDFDAVVQVLFEDGLIYRDHQTEAWLLSEVSS